MKTKIVIGGLLAVLMLVIVPFLTGALTESTVEATTVEETPIEEATSEDTAVKETISKDTNIKEPTSEETTTKETTTKQTKYIRFGYIKATFSGVYEEDVDCDHGLVLKHNIVVNSTRGTLTTPLKINGETIVESHTPVTLKIKLMGPIGFRLRLSGFSDWTPKLHVGMSGFAIGITVTY